MADGQLVASGSFVSSGAVEDIVLRSDFDSFEVFNRTVAASETAGNAGFQFYWQKGFAADTGNELTRPTGTAKQAVSQQFLTSGGFTRIDEGDQSVGAAKALSGTEITNANPAVATCTAHGYSVGDRVIFSGTTAMLQIAGIPFEITTVGSANAFTLGYLNASGFASAATAGSVRRLPRRPLFQPEKLYITNITAAAQMVVTFSFAHGLVVGAKCAFSVASANGMIELDGRTGTVTAINTTTNTATFDIDSSAFTAWAWPVSGTVFTPAHAVPAGETNSILTMAEVNSGRILMRLAAGVDSPAGALNDVIFWRAYKSGFVDNI